MSIKAAPTGKRACVHLVANHGDDHFRRFPGGAWEYDLVCRNCSASEADIDSNLREVDDKRFHQIEDEGYWDGMVGRPAVRIRDGVVQFAHEQRFTSRFSPFCNLQPIVSQPEAWLGLTADGRLNLINVEACKVESLLSLPRDDIDYSQDLTLRVSRSGNFVAVAHTKGQTGVVLDTKSGRVLWTLRRSDYHNEHSPFPLAFVEWGGRTRLVHGVAWNRLDISDAETGELLTPRSPTSYGRGEQRPSHYLDYFHGELSVSPAENWIADNGWVWHPSGVVASWNLPAWLNDNVWESEDGPTRRALCARAYFWHGALYWLDERRLVVSGYGNDDEWMIPGVCIYDALTGKQIQWFPGPKGRLAVDRELYSWDAAGLAAWDIERGERVAFESGLCPAGFHPTSKTFLSILDGTTVCRTRIVR